MVNKKFGLGILALVLVLGMTVIACSDGNGDSADSALNGNWIDEDGVVLALNDGSFTARVSGTDIMRGSYSTSGRNLTITISQIHTNFLALELEIDSSYLELFGIPEGWYNRNQMLDLFEDLVGEDEETVDAINEIFAPMTGTYEIEDGVLTMTMDDEITTYTRQ